MPRQTPSSHKAAALPPRTHAILHRAIAAARPLLEPLEDRRLLTSLGLYQVSMLPHATEDGRYTADFQLQRFGTLAIDTLAFTLTGVGARPADPSDVLLTGNGIDNDLHTFTFPANESQVIIQVAAVQDALFEADEDLRLDFFDPSDLATPLASADVLVKSDDNELWVEGGGLMNENGGQVTFTIHREDLGGACTNPANVFVRLKSAGHGPLRAALDDYQFLDSFSGDVYEDPDTHLFTIEFSADQSTRSITVAAVNDAKPEPEEWLKLALLYASEAGTSIPVPLSSTLPTQAFAGIIDDDNYTAPPNAPTNLAANPFSDTAITLNWQDNSTDETGFLLEKSADRVNWSTVQVFEPDTTTATVDNLDPAIDYAFRLRAENPSASVPSDFTQPLPASTQWQNLGAPLAVPIATTGESPIWLNNGESLVAGEGYRLVYSSGGVNYSSQSPPNTWTAASYAVRSEDWHYTHWQNEPNGFPFVSSLAEVPSIANDLTWSFTSPGAPMALYFNAGDPQYYSGPGVTWQLQKQIPHVSAALNNGDHTTEGDTTPLQVTLTRDAYFNEPLTVHYTLTSGTADASDILDQYSGTAIIDANSFSVDIPLLATDDSTPEWTENLQFQITSGTGYFAAGDPANIHVKDNDLSFTLRDTQGNAVADGGMLVANYDDDDSNNITDYMDPAAQDIGADDDLYELTLNIPDGYTSNSSVTLITTSGFFNIYDSQSKELQLDDNGAITWTDPSQVPSILWLEVKQGSTSLDDINVRLASTDNGDNQLFEQQFAAVNLHIVALTDPNNSGVFRATNVARPWLVGQITSLAAIIDAPTNWTQNATYRWTVPGNILRDYEISPSNANVFSVVDDFAAGPDGSIHTGYRQRTIDFFWIDNANGPGTSDERDVSVSIGNVNGRDFSLSTFFQLHSPIVDNEAVTLGIPTLRWDSQGHRTVELRTANGAGNGFKWKAKVLLPQVFGSAVGYFNFAQLATIHRSATDGQQITNYTLNGRWGHDGLYPYDGLQTRYSVETDGVAAYDIKTPFIQANMGDSPGMDLTTFTAAVRKWKSTTNLKRISCSKLRAQAASYRLNKPTGSGRLP